MKRSLLIDNKYKKLGVILLIPSLVLGGFYRFGEWSIDFLTLDFPHKRDRLLESPINLTDEFALTGIIVGLLLIAFSREKTEDEYISKIRLESLQWAVLINYLLLIIATWLVHGFGYIDVMMYNMLTVLIIFIIRFHFVLRRNNKNL